MNSSDEDVKQLDLLAIFHYVLGGILCVPLVFFFNAIGLLLSGFFLLPVFLPFINMGILALALVVCIFMTAWNLKQKTRYKFCFAVACIECAVMPLGTILGVFTIIALSKDSVKAAFNGVQPPDNSSIST